MCECVCVCVRACVCVHNLFYSSPSQLAQVRFCSLVMIVFYSLMRAKIQMEMAPKDAWRIALPKHIVKTVIKFSYFKRDNLKVMGHFFLLTLYYPKTSTKDIKAVMHTYAYVGLYELLHSRWARSLCLIASSYFLAYSTGMCSGDSVFWGICAK